MSHFRCSFCSELLWLFLISFVSEENQSAKLFRSWQFDPGSKVSRQVPLREPIEPCRLFLVVGQFLLLVSPYLVLVSGNSHSEVILIILQFHLWSPPITFCAVRVLVRNVLLCIWLHSSVDGHVGFHSLAIMNNTAYFL